MFTPFAFIQDAAAEAVANALRTLYIGGEFTTYNTTNTGKILRIFTDGTVDTTFISGSGFGGNGPQVIMSQSDGKIIASAFTAQGYSGSFTHGDGFVRINTNGTVDPTLQGPFGFTGNAWTLVTASSGLYIGGGFTSYSSSTARNLIRVNTFGQIDTTWKQRIGANSTVRSIATQSNGKIIVAGGFTSYSSSFANYLAKIDRFGDVDTTFNTGIGFNSAVYCAATQSDGKLVVGGSFTSYSGSSINRIARLNTDGTLDTTFKPGAGPNGIPSAVVVFPNGKIVIGGGITTYSGSSRNNIIGINSNGTLDTTFNIGTGANAAILNGLVDSTGKIIVVGEFTTYSGSARNGIMRLNSDGTLDTTFNVGTGLSGSSASGSIGGYCITMDSSSRLLVGGPFTRYSSSAAPARNRMARINTNGTLDTTFAMAGTGFSSYIISVATQPDGKILATGAFTTINGASTTRITRLDSNGTVDTSFKGTGFTLGINAVNSSMFNQMLSISSSGNITLTGNFSTYSGSNFLVNNITQLTPSGSINTNFITGLNSTSSAAGLTPSGDVGHLLETSTGKIFIFGSGFTSYKYNPYVMRLNTNGTIDNTFQIGRGPNFDVYKVAVQTDDKIILVGPFTQWQGAANNNRIIRLNSDGTKDTTYNIGAGLNSTPIDMKLTPDNRVVVIGQFTTYSGSSRNYIVRINTNGTLDTTYNIGTGFGASPTAFGDATNTALAIDSGSNAYVGGNFTTYSGSSINRIVKISTFGSIDTSFNVGAGANNYISTIQLMY
jgi:uncharacterized delta-60 repeat protein